jgi:hypothetical protein
VNYAKAGVLSVWWAILAALFGAAGFSLLTTWTFNDANAYLGLIVGPPFVYWLLVGLYEGFKLTREIWEELS